MAKKTNKTSHVMNLLTNGASPEGGGVPGDSPAVPEGAVPAAPAAAVSAVPEKKGDIQSHTVVPSKVTVVDEGSRNDRISQEILNNLSEALEEETVENSNLDMEMETSQAVESALADAAADEARKEAPAPAAQPPEEPEGDASVFATVNAQETSPQPDAPAAESAGESAPSAPSPAPQKQETPKIKPDVNPKTAHHAVIQGSNLIDDQYCFVNIMEQLILRQDINSYMNQYNVCKCARCMADVCALALSGMPAKYVVTSKDSISPLVSYYESRNKVLILTELIKACNKVRENPRHDKA